MQNHRDVHLKTVPRVLRYINGTVGQGLVFSSTNDLVLRGFCDNDWGTCPITKRFITRYCMLLGNSLISWHSKKQYVVCRSTAEAEHRALATTTYELIWLSTLLKDLQLHVSLPISIFL